MEIRLAFGLILLVTTVEFCGTGTQGSVQIRTATPPAAQMPSPSIVCVPEGERLPPDSAEHGAVWTKAESSAFAQQWQLISRTLTQEVTADTLAALSRWAQKEMAAFSLPANWIAQIPMHPLAASRHQPVTWIGQYTEEGLPLPSPQPLVFRRLLVIAEFHRATKKIGRVFVTIRGWVEE